MVLAMVVIGGITRLTDSGLSIVDWKPIMRPLPPLNHQEWMNAFNKYKQFPEFKLINSAINLSEFKSIYFWEYLHRALGRLMGLVFFFPWLYFTIKKKFTLGFQTKVLFGFLLGGLQGLMGWYMVQSGLVNEPEVSQYRLASHLILAFIILGYFLWLALDLMNQQVKYRYIVPQVIKYSSYLIVVLVTTQVIYGAFMSSLNAGLVFDTFPLMDGKLIPTPLIDHSISTYKNYFENSEMVHFIHRSLGWLLLLVIPLFIFSSHKYMKSKWQKTILVLFLGMILTQFLLGVFTVLWHVPISLASIHQVGACILFILSVTAAHASSEKV
jgi:heme a synthase